MRLNAPLTSSFFQHATLICTGCGAMARVANVEGPFDEGPFHRFVVTLENGCKFVVEQDLRKANAELN